MPDLPPPVPAIEFVLSSRGMSKGLAQTDGAQALVRGQLAFGEIYFSAYAKNVDSSTADGEAAAQIGVRDSAGGFDLSATAGLKRAIDPTPGSDKNALEVNASLGRKIGRLSPKLSLTWSPDDVGSTGRTIFAEASAGYHLGDSFSASAAIGRRERTGGGDYTAWNAGLAWSAKPLTIDLRYYDTDGGDSHAYRERVVVSARLKL
ncbi:MAG TPA: hypothetical protein VFP53_02770 [Sphingomicrobium sp.]|nr:hypothetical protein [Sphingomicrobium sp.]